jgi:hypothetical protein
MKRLALVGLALGLALALGGWSWYSATWGTNNTVSLPDGGVGIPLSLQDGGNWSDGGFFADAGIADAGPPYNDSNYILDGGPLFFGLAPGATYTSDPIYASSALAMNCYATTQPSATGAPKANFVLQLVGSTDQRPIGDGGIWQNYDAGTNLDTYTCAALDGGSCGPYPFFQSPAGELFPSSAVRITNNSDGGYLFCPFGSQ